MLFYILVVALYFGLGMWIVYLIGVMQGYKDKINDLLKNNVALQAEILKLERQRIRELEVAKNNSLIVDQSKGLEISEVKGYSRTE